MNWEAIGAVGEILGAVAVVGTLFYLTTQIRQATRVAKANMTKDLFLTSRSATMELARDSELSMLFADIRGIEDTDFSRRATFYQSFFRLYELVFTLHKQDMVDEGIFDSYLRMIRVFAGTSYFDDYWDFARPEFQQEFYEFVCEQRDMVRDQTNTHK